MNQYDNLIVSPGKLKPKQIKQIAKLHRQRLNLSAKVINEMYMDKDKLYLYYERNSQELVGMIGTKIIVHDTCVLVYYGSTVIKKAYQHSHFLPHAIQHAMKYLYIRYPMKEKYHAALTSSPGSFIYFSRFKPSWPNPDSKIPEKIFNIMLKTIKALGGDYKISENSIVSTQLSSNIDKLHKNYKTSDDSIFSTLNPNYNRGDQLLVLARFTPQQLANFMFYAHHDALIKQQGHYRKIKRMRLKHPLKAFSLITFSLYKKKLAFLCTAVLSFSVILSFAIDG